MKAKTIIRKAAGDRKLAAVIAHRLAFGHWPNWSMTTTGDRDYCRCGRERPHAG